MSLKIKNDTDGITIIVDTILIPGEPYFKEFEELSTKIGSFDSSSVIIDLSQCKYMDTRAISIILEMNGILKKKGRKFKLINVGEEIADLLCSIKLDKIIQIC